MAAVDVLNGFLAGTPYLLDNSEVGERRAAFLMEESERIQQRQDAVQERFAAESEDLRRRVTDMLGARLVYESNALELTGVPLAETQSLIQSAPDSMDQLSEYVARQAVNADKHIVDVLGLHEANVFARQLAHDYAEGSVPLREVDVRSLHVKTLPTERFGGTYRSIEVGISGSEHRPPSVLDVPRDMATLVEWANETSAPPALVAAVVHSWLTIIHPFQDGNGRVARLMANIVLMRCGWPPLIVRASDRLQYLDALATSDAGGDLLPLFDLFIKSIKRGLKELEKPDLLRRLFEADLRKDDDLRYRYWSGQLNLFLDELRRALRPYGFDVDRLAVPATSTFQLLEEGEAAGSTWLAKLRHQDGRDYLLWLGFMTHEMLDNSAVARSAPSIFIGERDRREAALHPYGNSFTMPPDVGIREVSLLPGLESEPALVRVGTTTVIERPIAEAARDLAKAIAGARPRLVD